jgi:transcriptional regulator with XRE-family HTH domain
VTAERVEEAPGLASDPCRRPLQGWELSLLAALGERLRELREGCDLSQVELGERAQVSRDQVGRIERGRRRTRRSTLARLVGVLADQGLDGDRVLAELLELAGDAVAPESAFAGRVERRRVARFDRRRRQAAWRAEWAERMAAVEREQAWLALVARLRQRLGYAVGRLSGGDGRPYPTELQRAKALEDAQRLSRVLANVLGDPPARWRQGSTPTG